MSLPAVDVCSCCCSSTTLNASSDAETAPSLAPPGEGTQDGVDSSGIGSGSGGNDGGVLFRDTEDFVRKLQRITAGGSDRLQIISGDLLGRSALHTYSAAAVQQYVDL